MALVKFIPSPKSQTSGGLLGTLRYCCREDKTEYQDRYLVTGINCVPQTAYQEFMNTKRLYEKTDGRMFYQLLQSFSPDENISPETAHEIALKLAEQFSGYEVVVATHTDRDHIHSHFIINSVNSDTGKKYHSDKNTLQKLRDVSDQLCLEYGLSVIQPRTSGPATMSAREYRAVERGPGWKLQLEIVIDEAMKRARSREHFIRLMEWEGYQVRWSDERKYITYTTPDGNRCRDMKLHEQKYRKEYMQNEFNIRETIAAGYESAADIIDEKGRRHGYLYSSHRGQLAGNDLIAEATGRNTDGYPQEVGDAYDQAGTDQIYESAAYHFEGTGTKHLQRVRTISGRSGDDSEPDNGANGETGWEHERTVFLSTLFGTEENEALHDYPVSGFTNPKFDYFAFGLEMALIVAQAVEQAEYEKRRDQRKKKYYRPDHKLAPGQRRGGL